MYPFGKYLMKRLETLFGIYYAQRINMKSTSKITENIHGSAKDLPTTVGALLNNFLSINHQRI